MSVRRGFVIVAHRAPGFGRKFTLAPAWWGNHLYASQKAAARAVAEIEAEMAEGRWEAVVRVEVCEVRS